MWWALIFIPSLVLSASQPNPVRNDTRKFNEEGNCYNYKCVNLVNHVLYTSCTDGVHSTGAVTVSGEYEVMPWTSDCAGHAYGLINCGQKYYAWTPDLPPTFNCGCHGCLVHNCGCPDAVSDSENEDESVPKAVKGSRDDDDDDDDDETETRRKHHNDQNKNERKSDPTKQRKPKQVKTPKRTQKPKPVTSFSDGDEVDDSLPPPQLSVTEIGHDQPDEVDNVEVEDAQTSKQPAPVTTPQEPTPVTGGDSPHMPKRHAGPVFDENDEDDKQQSHQHKKHHRNNNNNHHNNNHNNNTKKPHKKPHHQPQPPKPHHARNHTRKHKDTDEVEPVEEPEPVPVTDSPCGCAEGSVTCKPGCWINGSGDIETMRSAPGTGRRCGNLSPNEHFIIDQVEGCSCHGHKLGAPAGDQGCNWLYCHVLHPSSC